MIEPGRTLADRALIALFLTAILLPSVDLFFRVDPTPANAEQNPGSPAPRLERPISPGRFVRYVRVMRAHLRHNFGFRKSLLRLSNLAELRLFGRFSTPDVVPGKEDWLVYNSNQNLVRAPHFVVKDLERWREAIEWRRDWCQARGIPYLLVFAPNPQTIYPEILPNFLARRPEPSVLDQLIPHLSGRSQLEILDLREPLFNARSIGRLYHRTDSHWNELGAFVAYRAIMGRIARWIPGEAARPLDSFRVVEEPGPGGDLAGMIALRDLIGETEVRLIPDDKPEARGPGGGPLDYETICVKIRPIVEAEVAGSKKPRAVVVRDSFGSALVPRLSEHFSRVVYTWRSFDGTGQPFPVEIIDRERPAVVIDEFAERMVTSSPPVNPSGSARGDSRSGSSRPDTGWSRR